LPPLLLSSNRECDSKAIPSLFGGALLLSSPLHQPFHLTRVQWTLHSRLTHLNLQSMYIYFTICSVCPSSSSSSPFTPLPPSILLNPPPFCLALLTLYCLPNLIYCLKNRWLVGQLTSLAPPLTLVEWVFLSAMPPSLCHSLG
jgi:hypothetical protein